MIKTLTLNGMSPVGVPRFFADYGTKRYALYHKVDQVSDMLHRAQNIHSHPKLQLFSAVTAAMSKVFQLEVMRKTYAEVVQEFEHKYKVDTKLTLSRILSHILCQLVPEEERSMFGGLQVVEFHGAVVVIFKRFSSGGADAADAVDLTVGWGQLTEEGKRLVADWMQAEFGQSIHIRNTYFSRTNWIETITITLESAESPSYVEDPETASVVAGLSKEIEAFRNAGLGRKLLILGPPGVGKTVLASHIAGTQQGTKIFSPKADNYYLQVAGALAECCHNPTVILDDVDRHPGDTKQALGDEGYMPANSVIIATANTIDTLDPALLRPGRFDRVFVLKEVAPSWLKGICNKFASTYGLVLSREEHEALQGLTPAEAKEVIKIMALVGRAQMKQEVARVLWQRSMIDLTRVKVTDLQKGLTEAAPQDTFDV